MSQIHPTAIIDSSAQIGSDVTIGPYAIVGPQVVLGDRCKIHPHAVLEYVELGPGCEVYSFASVGLPAQHLGYKGEPAKVVVGENTIFRENVTVHRGTAKDKCLTKIGKNCFFMALSHVAHDCVIGDSVVLANAALLAGHVQAGDRVFVSGTAAVHQFVRLGTGAMISGGSMVSLDVPPYGLVQGDRAVLRGINLVGLRRFGVSRETVRLVKEAFKIVFYSGQGLEEALSHPIFKSTDPCVNEIKIFLSDPKRGFVRPPTGSSTPDVEEAAV